MSEVQTEEEDKLQQHRDASYKLKKHLEMDGVELIKINSTNARVEGFKGKQTTTMIKSLGRTAMQKAIPPDFKNDTQGDIHCTPMGWRVLKSIYRKEFDIFDWYENVIIKPYFPSKLDPIMLTPALLEGKASLLIPRGYHPVYTQIIPNPHLEGTKFDKVEWKGITEHMSDYYRKEPLYPEWDEDFFEVADLVIDNDPLPSTPWAREIRKGEWIRKIRKSANAGFPDYYTQSERIVEVDGIILKNDKGVEYRDWLYDKFHQTIVSCDFEQFFQEKAIYSAFYRTQPGKDRLVAGGYRFLKALGAALNSVIIEMYRDTKDGIAWQDNEAIRDYIFEGMKTYPDGVMISVDFSSLDSTFRHSLIKYILIKVAERWSTVDPDYGKVLEYIQYAMTDGAYLALTYDYMIKVLTGLLSGTPLTQWIDSMLMKIFTKKMEQMSGLQIYSLHLGDDVIWIGPPEIMEHWDDWVAWITAGGFIVSEEKSHPNKVDEGGGIFLQYLYYMDEDPNVVGIIWRRILSWLMIERDSSLVKSVDTRKYEEEMKRRKEKIEYKALWALRTMQIFATLVPDNIPYGCVNQLVRWLQLRDKFMSDRRVLEKALYIQDTYGTDEEFWRQGSYLHPKKYMSYI